MCPVDTRSDRLVLVPARQLDDLAELARLASNRLDDPVLADALRGAIAGLTNVAVAEPM